MNAGDKCPCCNQPIAEDLTCPSCIEADCGGTHEDCGGVIVTRVYCLSCNADVEEY